MKPTASLLVLGALIACLLLELLFRILPVSTSTSMGYYVDNQILSYPPYHQFIAASGWNLEHPHKLSANSAGFVASREFSMDPKAVALIGDSFVEGSMLDVDDRLSNQIERALTSQSVYALGAPGSSLLDYTERMRFAADNYSIGNFVIIIEEGDVLQAICGSGQIHSRCYDEQTASIVPFRQASATSIKKVLRQSALAQYLTSQLKLDIAGLFRRLADDATNAGPSGISPDTTKKKPDLEKIIDVFFADVARFSAGHVILVLEDRTVSGFKRSALQSQGRGILVEKATWAGVTVIDTGPMFRNFTTETGLSIAVSPRDHHWNRAATRLVAEAVAQALNSAG